MPVLPNFKRMVPLSNQAPETNLFQPFHRGNFAEAEKVLRQGWPVNYESSFGCTFVVFLCASVARDIPGKPTPGYPGGLEEKKQVRAGQVRILHDLLIPRNADFHKPGLVFVGVDPHFVSCF